MSHVIFATYGHPSVHEKVKTEINNWRYPTEGKLRNGFIAPILSEIRFYDVRIPKEHSAQFVKDMQLNFNTAPVFGKSNAPHKLFYKTSFFFLNLGRKLFGLKSVKTPEAQMFNLTASWHYSYLIGVMDDPEMYDELLKSKKEVL